MDKYQDTSFRRQVQITAAGVKNAPTNETLALSSYRHGVENVLHLRDIREHGNATTPLTAQRQLAYYKPGFVRWEDPQGRECFDSTGGLFLTAFEGLPLLNSKDLVNSAVAKASSKYFSKLASLRGSLTSGQEFLGEIRETLNFIRRPFKSGVDVLTSLFTILGKGPHVGKKSFRSRKNPNSIFKITRDGKGVSHVEVIFDNTTLILRDLGSQWLEVRFGLLPLIKDIAALSEIATQTARQARISTHRCYGKEESANPRPELSFARVLGIGHWYNATWSSKAECVIRFGYLEKVLTALERRNAVIQETFFNLNSLPLTMWELIPLSCFFDYFVNAGEMINSVLESQENVSWISQSVITTDDAEYTEQPFRPTSSVKKVLAFSPIELIIHSRKVVRTATPIGISPLVVSLPTSPIRLTNLAAFLTGLLHK